MPHLFTICGSLRAESHNSALLNVAEAEVRRLGATVERYGALRSLPHFDQDLENALPPEVNALKEAVTAADGIIIATPTYNGALPGALKDWLDWLSRPLGKSILTGKPVAVVTSSIGPNAGNASADYLERICKAFRAQFVYPITSVPSVQTTLDDGRPDDIISALINETAQAILLTIRGAQVVDNAERNRFELIIDDQVTSYSNYRSGTIGNAPVVELPHTVTEPEHRAQGMAAFLTRSLLDLIAQSETGTRVNPSCDFVAQYIAQHPKYQPLLQG